MVDAVSAVGANTASNTSGTSSVGKLDYEAFLKLLIAQLENQDPTKPMESTEFVAQLATFSNVEQSISLNKKLDTLLTSSSLTLAEGLIGRDVASADGEISGTVDSVKITSEGPVATLDNGATLTLGSGLVIS